MQTRSFTRRHWMILCLFGLVGQIAWSVENMYFNLFLFDTVSPNLDAVTLMVQLSGIVATLTTLVAGTLSDRSGNRRTFLSLGYLIWGVTVGLFGFFEVDLFQKLFALSETRAISVTLIAIIVGDCVMTVFGSTANDAAFNAWVTDNTQSAYRGKVEGILSILPLLAMLIVAGGFGILVELVGYRALFLGLGVIITLCGLYGLRAVKDSPTLQKKGSFLDILYGFRPSVIRSHPALYLTLCLVGIYGIACQIFMPYLIIYMKTYLGFSVLEYSVVFGAAILIGAGINLPLTALSDRHSKAKLLYPAAGMMALGLFLMYLCQFSSKTVLLLTFGGAGLLMITGYIFVSALCGALVRDYTPAGDAGKLQGIRMIFSVLIPMLVGPMIGNAINRAANIPLPDLGSADVMTTEYIPAPGIFLAAALTALVVLALIPALLRAQKMQKEQ